MEVRRHGELVPVRARMVRAVLVSLLLKPGQVVATETLMNHLWGREHPASARVTVRNYVRRLRIALHPELVQTSASGYVLCAPREWVDVCRFDDALRQAGHESRTTVVRERLAHALSLWRGTPMAGLGDLPVVTDEGPRLNEQYLLAVEDHAEATLALRTYEALIPRLAELAVRYPLRERLVSLWMHALRLAGRRAEALDVYLRTRNHLVSELGVEPGAELRSAHQQALAEDEPLPSGSAKSEPERGVRAHAQLPMDIEEFTGRQQELHQLRDLAQARPGGTATPIAVITGMAGVGKTRLALHSAHTLVRAGRYPDLQLWVELRGYDPDQDPVGPFEALERCLRLLGVPAGDVPPDLDSRAALFRDRLVGKKVLLILDNAVTEEQVRPLLPASTDCLVIITSRRALVELDGAHIIPLDVFSPGQAVELLSRLAGADTISRDTAAAAEICRLCGYLPLAVALAGRRLRADRSGSAQNLVRRLNNDRLGRSSTGSRSPHAVFDLSYQALTEQQRHAFRRLSLHPGNDLTPAAAAALAGVDSASAHQLVEGLADEHLLYRNVSGRFRFHDLIKAFARDRAAIDDSPAQRQDAIQRLLGHYIHSANAARSVLTPHGRCPVPQLPDGAFEIERFADYDAALAWCEAEKDNLSAAIRVAATKPTPAAWQLPAVLLTFYYLRSHWAEWAVSHRSALAAARTLDDVRGEAVILKGLGVLWSDLHRFDESLDCHHQAHELFAELDDSNGTAWNLNNLGVMLVELDRLDEAEDTFDRALALFRASEDGYGEGICLNNLGDTRRRLGDPHRATEHLHEALEIQRRLGDNGSLRYSLATLADICCEVGNHDQAIDYYRAAITASEETGDHRTTARTQANLADALERTGRAKDAREAEHLRKNAVSTLAKLGDPLAESPNGGGER
ncbi:tetratricopeptide repeat protein [Prauserella sp. ASG 168]|uniref:Tetratricopeptide repeat protein n=1 Tax=Prauserella cavernicola TaxID=2800127 RepID=A0A934V644_9PSEU|nr:tetratricopeptide repeat protein [Prauserella cavernicola]